MTASPLVTCIVPVFNGERYLGEALESILAQTHRPIEIIVADDGSTDGTLGVVAHFAPTVRCLSQKHAGPAAARNLGLGAARGELVAFLDADDRWHPEKLARQVARFRARPGLDACVTLVQNFPVAESAEEERRSLDHRRAGPLPGYTTGTLLARRALFESVGRFNPALVHADDTEWFLRAAERGAVMELVTEVLAYRRVHAASLSHQRAAESLGEYLRLVKASLDHRRGPDRAVAPLQSFPLAGPPPEA